MSTNVVLKVEGLGKHYQLGTIGTGTVRADLARAWNRLWRNGKGDWTEPSSGEGGKTAIWAIRDINFEVHEGEVLGIIGRNGAGKSTLLKILSRITAPTTGRATIHGRVGSLLEVGTGFHPELTGRENVFLNGAILGMRRVEIARKLDEIVDFAEMERFIDTPVKRYSSGMTVRLAFAVAAHLEPEILIIDEVLAVGDVQFQAKCLGKMKDVAGHGRTVLFVSHNMSTIQALCSRAILLSDGEVATNGGVDEAVSAYSSLRASNESHEDLSGLARTGAGNVRFHRIRYLDEAKQVVAGPTTGKEVTIELRFSGSLTDERAARIGLAFQTVTGANLFFCSNETATVEPMLVGCESVIRCTIPRFPLTAGLYSLTLFLERNGIIEDWLNDSLPVHVEDGSFFGTTKNSPGGWEGKTTLVQNTWVNASR